MKSICFIWITTLYTSTSEVVFVEQQKSWLEARKSCKEEYGGHLATLDITTPADLQLVQSCMQEGNAWFGNYSISSAPIAVLGCFGEEALSTTFPYILSKWSVNECQRKCYAGYFAIKGNICKCLIRLPGKENMLRPMSCDIICDQIASCGGNASFTVYWISTEMRGYGFRDCGAHTCYADVGRTINFDMHDCTNMYNFSCDDNATEKEYKTWFAARETCFTKGNYLSPQFVCPQRATTYWNGYFVSEEFVFDEENLSEQPQRATAMGKNAITGDFALLDPIGVNENLELNYFCASGKQFKFKMIREQPIFSSPESSLWEFKLVAQDKYFSIHYSHQR